MRILVTGATGFIGNNLVNELLKDKNIEIISTSRCNKKASKFDWFSKVKHIPYDINSNKDLNLFDYFDKPDKVIHLAWDGLPNYNDLIHIEKNLFHNYYHKNLNVMGQNILQRKKRIERNSLHGVVVLLGITHHNHYHHRTFTIEIKS